MANLRIVIFSIAFYPAAADAADGSGKAPPDSLEEALVRISGVDLTLIDGIDTNITLKIISEIGTDMSRWKTAKHFASWLGLCPGTKISGGKPLSTKSKRVVNRAATALRLAAQSLLRSKSALGVNDRSNRATDDRRNGAT